MAATLTHLEEAENAYHALMTGAGIAEFRDQNGETVKYAKADIGKLGAYIESLKSELGLKKSSSGPMRVWM